jgi:plasmid maintenance system antidote protein VapI
MVTLQNSAIVVESWLNLQDKVDLFDAQRSLAPDAVRQLVVEGAES